jgi:hypothetical protein
MADEYAKMIYDMAKQGKIGFSSGSASHMVEREMMGKAYEIKRWALAEASLTPTPAESRNMVEAKRYFDDEGRFVDYTEKEKMEMSKKSEDEYESEDGEVDDMVEGLMMINATPEEIASTIYDGVEEDLVADSIHCLYKRMIRGVLGVIESNGDLATINAVVQGFHDRVIVVADKYVAMPEAQMSMEMEAMKGIVAKSPENIKQCERALRDAMDLSRSQAKGLAKLVWNHLRDVDETQEPQIKTIDISGNHCEKKPHLPLFKSLETNSSLKILLLVKKDCLNSSNLLAATIELISMISILVLSYTIVKSDKIPFASRSGLTFII